MGQARNRGTHEQRVAAAIERDIRNEQRRAELDRVRIMRNERDIDCAALSYSMQPEQVRRLFDKHYMAARRRGVWLLSAGTGARGSSAGLTAMSRRTLYASVIVALGAYGALSNTDIGSERSYPNKRAGRRPK